MRVVFYTNNVSPHQLPLAEEVAVRVGRANFLYVGEELEWRGRRIDARGLRTLRADAPEAKEWLENAEVLYTGGLRPIGLMERRAKRGLKTLYYSERWFKPVPLFDLRLFDCLIGVTAPGWVRMLVPGYRKMAKRFARLANEHPCVKFLAIGPWARRDFLRLGVRSDRLVDWGYFVAPTTVGGGREEGRGERRNVFSILWVGRMIGWKRTDAVIRAAKELRRRGVHFELTLVGEGTEKDRLIRLARRLFPNGVAVNRPGDIKSGGQTIVFLPSLLLEDVRRLMREYDLHVLTSDAQEGWGAIVSEALEEGMRVIGTFEAGASAAILPRERLFHAGDWKALARLIEREMRGELPPCAIGQWTARKAAERLMVEGKAVVSV